MHSSASIVKKEFQNCIWKKHFNGYCKPEGIFKFPERVWLTLEIKEWAGALSRCSCNFMLCYHCHGYKFLIESKSENKKRPSRCHLMCQGTLIHFVASNCHKVLNIQRWKRNDFKDRNTIFTQFVFSPFRCIYNNQHSYSRYQINSLGWSSSAIWW